MNCKCYYLYKIEESWNNSNLANCELFMSEVSRLPMDWGQRNKIDLVAIFNKLLYSISVQLEWKDQVGKRDLKGEEPFDSARKQLKSWIGLLGGRNTRTVMSFSKHIIWRASLWWKRKLCCDVFFFQYLLTVQVETLGGSQNYRCLNPNLKLNL